MSKVRMIADDEMRKATRERGLLAPVRVKVKLRQGEELRETVWQPKGGPSNPMSQDEIREKFRECARQAGLPASAAKNGIGCHRTAGNPGEYP